MREPQMVCRAVRVLALRGFGPFVLHTLGVQRGKQMGSVYLDPLGLRAAEDRVFEVGVFYNLT